MVAGCFCDVLPPPDTQSYVIGARVVGVCLSILITVAAFAYRTSAEQLRRKGAPKDKAMETSLRQMLGACAGVSSFIGMSAFRSYAAGVSSDWNNTTCALLLPVPCLVAAFFYKLAPWISGAPARAYSAARVNPITPRKENAPGGEDAPKEAACKGSVACVLSYARLFLFTLLFSTFSTVSLAGSYQMHLSAAGRAPGAPGPADTRSAEILKLDVDGDGAVSLEEMGFGTPPSRGRQLQLGSLLIKLAVYAGKLALPTAGKVLVPVVTATTKTTIAAYVGSGVVGGVVLSVAGSKAIENYQTHHPEIRAKLAKLNSKAIMPYDSYTNSAACQASFNFQYNGFNTTSTCVLGSDQYSCREIFVFGYNCHGCCDFYVEDGQVLYNANAFYCDCKWTSDYACPGDRPGSLGNAKEDNSACLTFCCKDPVFQPLHAGGAGAPVPGHTAGLVLELAPLPAGQQHALPVYTETVVILAAVPVYFMAKALHSRASRIQSPRPVSLV